MLFLFFICTSPILAVKCPRPEIPDGGLMKFQAFVEDNETMIPGEAVNIWCEDEGVQQPVLVGYRPPLMPYVPGELRPNTQVPPRKCNEDGTWSGKNLICGKNAAERLPLKTPDGNTSNLHTEWEVDLLTPHDVAGIRIIFVGSKDISFSVILSNSVGQTKNCSSADVPVRVVLDYQEHYSICDFANVENVKLTSSSPITVKDFIVISPKIGYLNLEQSPISLSVFSLRRSTGYTVGDTFILSDGKETFDKAKDACLAVGAELLENYSEKEWKIISRSMDDSVDMKGPRWIGLSAKKGIWRWESGQPLSNQNMPNVNFTAQPQNHLAVVIDGKLWSTASKTAEHKYICRFIKPNMSCPSPGSPEGGYNYPMGGTIVAHKNGYVYKCIEGYELIGESVRKCNTLTGKYMTEMPRCLKKDL